MAFKTIGKISGIKPIKVPSIKAKSVKFKASTIKSGGRSKIKLTTGKMMSPQRLKK